MTFTLYPAIDLRGGQCVRLVQGDFKQETVYSKYPVEVAKKWEKAGATWLHVVDLDAAKSGESKNLSVIEQLVTQTKLKVQVGGGVRDQKRLRNLLKLGVERIIIGSAAIEDQGFVTEALHTYGEKIVIGLDAKNGKIATHGWVQVSERTTEELAKQMMLLGAKTFIYTDISRDGMMQGVNLEGVRKLACTTGANVIASGGVSSMEDIEKLLTYAEEGITGAIIGKALYTDNINLAEAIQLMQKEG